MLSFANYFNCKFNKSAYNITRAPECNVLTTPRPGQYNVTLRGIEMTFLSGVYGASISHDKQFGSSAIGLLGISGIFIGVGEIFGGVLFGLLGKKTNAHGRDPIVMLGYVVHMVAFYLIFINIPENAPLTDSYLPTYIISNEYVAILCSFLLGFGDSSFNTQLYSIIGFMFPEDSSSAFALFKFVQSVAAAAAFYYSNVLYLQWQLLILQYAVNYNTPPTNPSPHWYLTSVQESDL
ncbi:DUF895 domain membrane protein [Bulinus truncatus]|nr:DUF895 domain membrane protein [Bulinus truncatus]